MQLTIPKNTFDAKALLETALRRVEFMMDAILIPGSRTRCRVGSRINEPRARGGEGMDDVGEGLGESEEGKQEGCRFAGLFSPCFFGL